MDLYAYTQIETLDFIAEKNGINCPRLRGYRLMRDENAVVLDDEFMLHLQISVIRQLIEESWGQNRISWWNDDDKQRHRYLIYSTDADGDEWATGIYWGRLNGRKKRMIKTRVRNELKKFKKQYDTFNKYVGRNDILYIHSRIGGGNWPYYYKYVVDQPWFIEKVDDACDSTYCDIYAKIEPFTGTISEDTEDSD